MYAGDVASGCVMLTSDGVWDYGEDNVKRWNQHRRQQQPRLESPTGSGVTHRGHLFS